MSKPLNIAVLISGRGSNMRALVSATEQEGFPASIVAVISNKPDAEGITFAKEHGIPTHIVNHKDFESREAFDQALHRAIEASSANFVCLAGFMRLLTPGFVQQWLGRMINIHPSLLPNFKGAYAHRDVLAAGVDRSGCTVHYVIPEMDAGQHIIQAEVPVLEHDTEETLAARVLEQEHILYPKAIQMIAEGEVSFEG